MRHHKEYLVKSIGLITCSTQNDARYSKKYEERFLRLRTKVQNYWQFYLPADREFVGEHWLAYLNFNGIRYHIRIKENFYVYTPHSGKKVKASLLFSDLKIGESKFLCQIYRVNNQLCYLSASKIKNKEGKPELQIIVSFNKQEHAQEIYKERWQIETAFRALKIKRIQHRRYVPERY